MEKGPSAVDLLLPFVFYLNIKHTLLCVLPILMQTVECILYSYGNFKSLYVLAYAY
jgi:hypothetical protein